MADYIEREAFLEHMERTSRYFDVKFDIEEFPAADVAPVKHGRWIPQTLLGTRVWDCSECKTIGSPQWKRCPICEAKMDLEVDHAEK